MQRLKKKLLEDADSLLEYVDGYLSDLIECCERELAIHGSQMATEAEEAKKRSELGYEGLETGSSEDGSS